MAKKLYVVSGIGPQVGLKLRLLPETPRNDSLKLQIQERQLYPEAFHVFAKIQDQSKHDSFSFDSNYFRRGKGKDSHFLTEREKEANDPCGLSYNLLPEF